MRRCVIGLGRESLRPEHDRPHPFSGLEALAAKEQRLIVLEAEGLLELGPGVDAGLLALDEALIADLPAALGIEGRLSELGQKESVRDLLERPDLGQQL